MSFKSFLKDRIAYIILILFASITSQILLLPSQIEIYVRIYVGITPIALFFVYFFIFFNRLLSSINTYIDWIK